MTEHVGQPRHNPVSMTIASQKDVAEARRFAVAHLKRWGLRSTEESATLMVSELVTNALVHAGGAVGLELRPEVDRVQICVTDRGPGLPTLQYPQDEADHGRGLMLVELLALHWGVLVAGPEKTVWVEIAANE